MFEKKELGFLEISMMLFMRPSQGIGTSPKCPKPLSFLSIIN